MKKYIILIALLVAASASVKAQKKKNEINYKVQYAFNGEVGENADSLYTISLVIDQKEVKKLDRIYIKMGSQTGWSDMFSIAINKNTLEKKNYDQSKEKEKPLSRKDSNILIDLGAYPRDDYYIEVNSKDKDGKYLKSKKKEVGQ